MEYAEIRSLLGKMPKAELGFFPTPFYRLDRLSKELGVQLYIFFSFFPTFFEIYKP